MSRINDELRRTFDLAILRREAEAGLRGQDWQRYREIKESFEAKRQAQTREFKASYSAHFEMARRRLIDKAGGKTRNFTPFWSQNDRFDRAAINRQADREVRATYVRATDILNRQEQDSIQNLLDKAASRRRLQEKPRRDFARAAERRSGMDRRQSRTREID